MFLIAYSQPFQKTSVCVLSCVLTLLEIAARPLAICRLSVIIIILIKHKFTPSDWFSFFVSMPKCCMISVLALHRRHYKTCSFSASLTFIASMLLISINCDITLMPVPLMYITIQRHWASTKSCLLLKDIKGLRISQAIYTFKSGPMLVNKTNWALGIAMSLSCQNNEEWKPNMACQVWQKQYKFIQIGGFTYSASQSHTASNWCGNSKQRAKKRYKRFNSGGQEYEIPKQVCGIDVIQIQFIHDVDLSKI